MQIVLPTSTTLLQEFNSTPGAYIRGTFKQHSNDATQFLGNLQLALVDNSMTDPVAEQIDAEIEWFNYLLARHRAVFQ